MPIDYGNLITRSWNIVWRYRVLWLFGFIVAFLSSGSNIQTNSLNTSNSTFNLEQFFAQYAVPLIAGTLLIIIIGIALSFVRVLAEAALIAAADQIERGTTALTIGGVWRMGRPYMLRMWLLQFMIGLVIFVLVLLMLLPFLIAIAAAVRANNPDAIFAATSGSFVIFCLALPVVALLSVALWLVQQHAMRALVLRDERVFQSLRSGWRTLRQHFGPSLLVLLIQIGLSIAIAVALFLIIIPLVGVLLFASTASLSFGASIALLVTSTLLAEFFGGAVATIPIVFLSALWTLLWRQLHESVAPTYATPTPVQPYQP